MYDDKKLTILKDILGNYRRSGSCEFLFYCPKCNHHKKKLSVRLDKGFHCWVCGYASPSIYRLVRKYGSFLQRKEWEDIDGILDHSVKSLYDELFGEEEKEEEQITSLPKEFVSLVNKKQPFSAMFANNYLKKRGITKQDILKWKIGYCYTGEYKERIIIPSFNKNGDVNFFVGRAFGEDWMKYKIPELSKDIVFNELYVDWKNDLVIVEGVFDAIKAGNSVPLLGSTLNEESKLFQEIIKHDTPIYVALDADAEKKALRLIRELITYGVEIYKVDVSGYNDVGEMSHEEFKDRKNKALPMSQATLLEYEVRNII